MDNDMGLVWMPDTVAARGQRRMIRKDRLIEWRRSGGHESVAARDPPGPGPRALKSHAT
jgi:hypothetical protein